MIKIIQADEHAPVPYDHKKTNYLRMKCKIKVDLVSEGGIMKFAKESIDNDKILIYERRT